MVQSPSPKTKTTKQSPLSASVLLLTMLDTTWRTFVPTIGGTFFGIFLDTRLNTKPIFTMAMIVIGFLTSIILIMLQLRKVRRQS